MTSDGRLTKMEQVEQIWAIRRAKARTMMVKHDVALFPYLVRANGSTDAEWEAACKRASPSLQTPEIVAPERNTEGV